LELRFSLTVPVPSPDKGGGLVDGGVQILSPAKRTRRLKSNEQ
jgi:hypothetical protein